MDGNLKRDEFSQTGGKKFMWIYLNHSVK
jgi:hypothetical protein